MHHTRDWEHIKLWEPWCVKSTLRYYICNMPRSSIKVDQPMYIIFAALFSSQYHCTFSPARGCLWHALWCYIMDVLHFSYPSTLSYTLSTLCSIKLTVKFSRSASLSLPQVFSSTLYFLPFQHTHLYLPRLLSFLYPSNLKAAKHDLRRDTRALGFIFTLRKEAKVSLLFPCLRDKEEKREAAV